VPNTSGYVSLKKIELRYKRENLACILLQDGDLWMINVYILILLTFIGN